MSAAGLRVGAHREARGAGGGAEGVRADGDRRGGGGGIWDGEGRREGTSEDAGVRAQDWGKGNENSARNVIIIYLRYSSYQPIMQAILGHRALL